MWVGVSHGVRPRPSPHPMPAPCRASLEGVKQHLEEGRDARGGAWRAFVWRGPLPLPAIPIVPLCASSLQAEGFPGSGWGRWVRHLPQLPLAAAFQKPTLLCPAQPPPSPLGHWPPGSPWWWPAGDPKAAGAGRGGAGREQEQGGLEAGDVAPS